MAEYISFQPSDFFNTTLYSGNGTAIGSGGNAITGVGFQPDFTWIKQRDGVDNHILTDAVRGATKYVNSDRTNAEATNAESLTTWGADGFTLGNHAAVNGSGDTFASWNWKESTTSKCDIVQYSGTGSAQTIAHNLGVKPDLIFIKRTDTTSNWIVYHQSLGATKFMYLNTTAAQETNSGVFNDTEPTSSVFTVNTWNDVNNSSGTYIAYVFAGIKGFSKFGDYTGNGNADGPFVYTGFRPAWVLLKRTVSADAWQLADNKRLGYNFKNAPLVVSADVAEDDATSYIDILSNGFKLRTTGTHVNNSGELNIYMAFAEFPIVSSNDMPTVAR